MPTSYTSLLGFALPATGELSGTWGTTVNNSITELVEDAIAATATASVAGGDWTLSTTGSGSANEARCAILIPTGSPGVSRNIIVPSQSKAYVVINQSDAAVVVKGAATTGVSLAAGEKAVVAWAGSDFVKVASSEFAGVVPVASGGTGQTTYTSGQLLIGNATGGLTKSTLTQGTGVTITNGNGSITIAATGSGGTVTSVGGTGTVNGISLSGTVTTTGNLTLGGSLSGVSLTSQVTGTLPVGNGGTGATTLAANNVLLGNGTSAFQAVAPGSSGNVLTSNGTTWTSATPNSGALVLLSTVTASPSSSTVNIETGIGSTYDYYVIQYDNVTLVDNGWHSYIGIRVKLDGSYRTSSYKFSSVWTGSSSGSTAGAFNSTSSSGIPVGVNSINTTYSSFFNKASGQVWFYNPTQANSIKTINWIAANVVTTSPISEFISGSGFCEASFGTLSGIQFLPLERPSNALFNTGTFRLYGFVKT